MAAKILRSLAVSAFCEDMAMMLAAGIQVDDALSLMRGDSGDGPLYDAASAVLERVQMGGAFGRGGGAMRIFSRVGGAACRGGRGGGTHRERAEKPRGILRNTG